MKKECIAVILAIGILGSASAAPIGEDGDATTQKTDEDTAASSSARTQMQNSMEEVTKKLDEYQEAEKKLKEANVDLSSEGWANYFDISEEEQVKTINTLSDGKDEDVKKTLQNALELRKQLQKYTIDPHFIYTEANVAAAWNGEWKDFCQCVVRVNCLEKTGETCVPYIGTGTVVDLGIPELKGKVVVTATHVVNSDLWNNSFCTIKNKNKKYFEGTNGLFDFNGQTTYLSVTPEIKEIKESVLPMVDTVAEHNSAQHLKVEQVYVFRNTIKKVRDTTILILEKPVCDENSKPLVGVDIIGNSEEAAEGEVEDGYFHYNCYVLGYGLTGVLWSGINNIGSPEDAVKEGLMKERQTLYRRLGFNMKKLTHVPRGAFLAPRVSGGFSGSLVVVKDDKNKIKFIGHPGYYSSLFTRATKKFFKNVKKELKKKLKTTKDNKEESCGGFCNIM
ncbi:MAG: hypothetical protein LBT70_03945 [Holosporaceae bacterium]|jgi:hypothetical protein|nr:hypothetical protein [Holosporaceae bacterium]